MIKVLPQKRRSRSSRRKRELCHSTGNVRFYIGEFLRILATMQHMFMQKEYTGNQLTKMAVMFLCFYLVFVNKSFISPDKTDTLLDLLPTYGYDVNTNSTSSCTFSSPLLIKRSPVIFETGSELHDIPPNVLTMLTGPPFHASSSSCRSRVTPLLLVLAGVESNPGPHHSFRLSIFNAEGASRKAAGLSDIITDNASTLSRSVRPGSG